MEIITGRSPIDYSKPPGEVLPGFVHVFHQYIKKIFLKRPEFHKHCQDLTWFCKCSSDEFSRLVQDNGSKSSQ